MDFFNARMLAVVMWTNVFILGWLMIARRVTIDYVTVLVFIAFFITAGLSSLAASKKGKQIDV